ncbi:MAG: hypothetical protein OSJ76_01820 [Alphaproteobacteria bacterium]|nr:hypothetical protein [Alphaproteobacteria bacterium]
MKTGDYAYFDGTISPEFDENKKFKGIVVVEDEYHAFAMHPEMIEDVDWYDGKKECEELFAEMPNLRQCQAIYDNKGVLNQSLTAAGFTPIDDETVWSSTEFNNNFAWRFVMYNGSRLYTNKLNSNGYVRPVLAL